MGFTELLKKASLAGAFFVSVAGASVAQAFCPAPSGLPSVEVKQVNDGDTLRLTDGRRVRLIGLNAPELGRQGRAAEPYAVAAHKRLQALVSASGGRVLLQVGRDGRDRYGRTLAHLYDSQGRNLEAQLLAEGLGYQVAVPPNVALVDCQRLAERSARAGALGIWRKASLQPAQSLERGGFTLLQGRVARFEQNRGGAWLELDGSLVLRIEPKHLAHFDLAALSSLTGRRIEARGWVIDRQRTASKVGRARWLLPLTHPSMLEVLP